MANDLPQVRILDAHGELDDVRGILAELGVPFADVAIPEGKEDPDPDVAAPLLVTTPAGAHALQTDGATGPAHHLLLVVADAPGVRGDRPLASVQCDYVLRRPLDPNVVRLLTERAGYGGPERRSVARVAVGAAVALRIDGQQRDGILAQLSVRGCGLITAFPLEMGDALTVMLPDELTSARPLALDGHVLSAREVATADGTNWDLSVAFDDVNIADRVTLRAIMAGRPIDARPRRRDGQARALRRRQPAHHAHRNDRRAAPRRRYRHTVLGESDGLSRVMLGRDLSALGMRVDRDTDLALGDRLALTLHAGAGQPAIHVDAVVGRDDGDDGWFLRFDEPDATTAEGLASLLDSLSPLGGSLGRGGIVVSEVRER